MPKPPIPMPDEQTLPAGALRSLVAYIHDLYTAAGKPALMKVERGTTDKLDDFTPVKKDRVAKLLHGDPDAAANWKYVEAVVAYLADEAHPGHREAPLAAAARLWAATRAGADQTFSARLPTDREDPVLRVSAHFARRSFSAHASAHWIGRGGRRGPRVLQGALAVSAHSFSPELQRLVFDPKFQVTHVRQLQEFGYLRRGSHSFDRHEQWGPSSYAVFGDITHGLDPKSFIHVEVHDVGVVAIYFRENVDNGTLSELIGWWGHGALHTALYILQHLGAAGPAEGCLLMDSHGIADVTPTPDTNNLDLSLSYLGHGRLSYLVLPEFALWDHAAGEPGQWLDRTAARLTSALERAANEAMPQGSPEPWHQALNRLSGGRRAGSRLSN